MELTQEKREEIAKSYLWSIYHILDNKDLSNLDKLEDIYNESEEGVKLLF